MVQYISYAWLSTTIIKQMKDYNIKTLTSRFCKDLNKKVALRWKENVVLASFLLALILNKRPVNLLHLTTDLIKHC